MQRLRLLRFCGLLTLLSVFVWSLGTAAEDPQNASRKRTSLSKTAGSPLGSILNINNFTTWFRSNGDGNNPPSLGGDGGYYPRGTKWVIFEDGSVWRAKAYLDAAHTQEAPGQLIRAGGQSYNISTEGGWVVGTGAAAVPLDPADDGNRMYRIRRDYTVMSKEELDKDAADFNEVLVSSVTQGMVDEIKAQYATDWTGWPVSQGAPYIERNGTPGYQPPPAFGANFTVDSLISGNFDEPGVAGADPNSPADQVIWTVMNDLNEATSQSFLGSDPLGLEIQATIWGYKRSDALGQLYFKRYRIINKGGVFTDLAKTTKGSFFIDSMFVCQWSDPDLGGFGDDLVGCDTTLSLGFVYNGNAIDNEFKKFNLPPPSAGYDFLAGPLVQSVGSTGVFDLKYRTDYANLPMTSFAYFSAGSAIAQPGFTYEGALRWYRMMDGYVPDPSTSAFRLYPSGPFPASKFPLSGDPVAGTGFLDGLGETYSLQPGDRRLLLNSGPFTLAPGDTQEFYVGTVGGIGSDRLSSVSVMKFNDKAVQNTFDALFAVPKAPLAPDVKIAQLDEQVILDWGSNPTRLDAIENLVSQPGNYQFEGYNVYQFPSAASTLADAKRIATYDLPSDPAIILDQAFDVTTGLILTKPIQYGSNSGLKRSFRFAQDYVKGTAKLFNGSEYYLAVTAYTNSKKPGFSPTALESAPNLYRVVPQTPPPGVRYTANYQDTVQIPPAPPSDGRALAIVINPTAMTGHSYKVTFAGTTWSLTDVTTNQVKLANQTNQSGDDNYAVADGLMVKVSGPPLGMKAWSIPSGTRRFSPVGGALFGLEGFSNGGDPNAAQDQAAGTIGAAANFAFGSITTSLSAAGYHNVLLKLAAVDNVNLWNPSVAQADTNFSLSYRYLRSATSAAAKPEFVPWIINPTAGYAYQDYIYGVPFSAWDMETTPPTRLAIGHLENNQPNGLVDGRYWPGLTDVDNGAGTGPREIIFIFATPYTPTAQAQYTIDFLGSNTPLMWVMTCARRAEATWRAGDQFQIFANHVNTPSTVFNFVAPSAATDAALAKADVGRIGVFPNPYYAFNSQEISRSQKFVTFTKMPTKATVRIYNLAGQLVAQLEKDDDSQFLRWNLNNQNNYPVASGMYIVHITMPDLGATKILKLGVIQEQEVPDVF